LVDVNEVEGVIKYQLDFEPNQGLAWLGFEELNAWRNILFNLHLIGQEEGRYDGYGYGNISYRNQSDSNDFYISGTQTGGKKRLAINDYCRITLYDVKHNHIVADGPVKPSSEALSHGAVYQLDSKIRCVIHVHSDVLWRCAAQIGLPCTGLGVPYGTVEMADEIVGLYRSGKLSRTRLFIMGGHKDGVIAFGETIEQAGAALIAQLALAIQNYK